MNQRHQHLATEVVNAFRDTLESAAHEAVGEHGFEELHQLICKALAVELHTTLERAQALLHELEAGVDRPQLEL